MGEEWTGNCILSVKSGQGDDNAAILVDNAEVKQLKRVIISSAVLVVKVFALPKQVEIQ
ncbi:hypothetical protein [Trichloromonas sp.]|uniref:hypothetical protein n=1 Tax=Trichloromonas sp. TaxID=3069249 RepID=UPI003D81A3EA